jgi:hypothetical protein
VGDPDVGAAVDRLVAPAEAERLQRHVGVVAQPM